MLIDFRGAEFIGLGTQVHVGFSHPRSNNIAGVMVDGFCLRQQVFVAYFVPRHGLQWFVWVIDVGVVCRALGFF
ncbi:hypothetical protein [Deefgea piscis]|uniref:hypothetical protein n=1 Tax=Deefgea piscis TaxID=2739061 RepID=UPI001C7FA16A|nr:hypothetical protein [Deefgea piscis]QZA81554.1 hypothetical protein K4H25_02500 [Deefgea piscis]